MTIEDSDLVARQAASAARPFAATSPSARSEALLAIAAALEAADAELIDLAIAETGLGRPRLAGELKRTAVQLRLFGDVVMAGSYLDVRIDRADPGFVLGARPDLRRTNLPVGPVLIFAASNFPFAFSVAGGDTASALAAGCPVVLKSHPGHPRLSVRTAQLVVEALDRAGMPKYSFQLVSGEDTGVALLKDDRIRAASFTGSLRAGRMLADIAASRPRPIPFFGELGSVNPVFVLPSGAGETDAIGAGFATSFSGSAGQLCTKPGFLFAPAGSVDAIVAAVAAALVDQPQQRLLNSRIGEGYALRRHAVLDAGGVAAAIEGTADTDDDGETWTTPTLAVTTLSDLLAAGDQVLDESFGPLSVVVAYDDANELVPAAEELFPGNLTSTVYAAADDSTESFRDLVQTLTATSGRILFGGWPTGVAVTPAMHHGGPWPATTADGGTSVGTAAVGRFLRAVTYQDAPQAQLPPPLQDDNPWRVPQQISEAGESAGWGIR
jgi:NADP-dependent aldehyde dehydrogenase